MPLGIHLNQTNRIKMSTKLKNAIVYCENNECINKCNIVIYLKRFILLNRVKYPLWPVDGGRWETPLNVV